MIPTPFNNLKRIDYLLWLTISALVISAYHPFQQPIWIDRAYQLYMAQVVGRGESLYHVTPYGYTPLGPLFSGLIIRFISWMSNASVSIVVSKSLGVILYSLTCVSFYHLAKKIFINNYLAHLAALFLVGVSYFSYLSGISFEPKLFAIILQLWAVCYVIDKKWLLSGMFISLSAMCWQPMIISGVGFFVFLVITKINWKTFLIDFRNLVSGGLIGTLPVIIYLSMSNSWVEFWNLTVVRKLLANGEKEGYYPFKWILSGIYPNYMSESLYFVFALIGLGVVVYLLLKNNKVIEKFFNDKSTVFLVMILTVIWALFNSYEFQGGLDLLPILPFVLLWSAFGVYYIIYRIKNENIKYVLMMLLVSYSFYDVFQYDLQLSLKDQKKFIKKISHNQHNAFVIDFEEYYVLQEKQMPTRYMRYAPYEDLLIDKFEANGCNDIISKMRNQRPSIIIEKVYPNKERGSCADEIISNFVKSNKYNVHKVRAINRPIIQSISNGKTSYRVYKTIFYSKNKKKPIMN